MTEGYSVALSLPRDKSISWDTDRERESTKSWNTLDTKTMLEGSKPASCFFAFSLSFCRGLILCASFKTWNPLRFWSCGWKTSKIIESPEFLFLPFLISLPLLDHQFLYKTAQSTRWSRFLSLITWLASFWSTSFCWAFQLFLSLAFQLVKLYVFGMPLFPPHDLHMCIPSWKTF